MGQVYLGQHSLTDRKVAVKILHQEYANNEEILTRIKREAKAAALIGHPNIVEIVDSGTDHFGAPFIAMELLKGASLDEYIDEHGPMAIPLATYIISDILETLDAAHKKGVVHRDIKPENIYMKTRHKSLVPHIKILDFGISKFLTMDKENMSLTKTGTVMGTPFYMSVEQAMGQKIDGRADQYSVAVILYQLLTTNLPYFDTNYNRVLLQIVAGEYTPIEQLRNDIPPQLVEVLNKAMAKDRKDRFENCAAFKEALNPFWNQFTPQEIFTQYSDFAAIINDNDSLALKTPTPQITDPNLITAAHNHTGKKSQTPYSTVTTGEVVLPNNSKSKVILIVAALIGTAFAAYFGLSYFQSSDESSDSVMVAAHNEKIEKPKKVEKDQPKEEKKKNLQLPSQVAIQVNNLPEKAKVYLNDTQLEKPFSAKGKKGSHLLRIEAEGYKSCYKTVK
jgi:serine/threonine protein kinase